MLILCETDSNGWLQGLVILVLVIGSYTVLRFIIAELLACCAYCRGRQDLRAKYGRPDGQTYALVTGGSEGLGLELCDQLALQGFNIVLLSRNQEKIDSKIEILRQKHPAIKFLGVSSDCSRKTSVQEYKDLIDSQLAGLDIGIVCLNAGCWVNGPTDLVSDSDYERVVGLNALHVVYFTKALLP